MTLPFCEPQVGGNCRIHALNAFYGSSRINTSQFNKYTKAYDAEYKRANVPPCQQWDTVLSNQENIIAYILRVSDGLGTLYIAPGQITCDRTRRVLACDRLTQIIDHRIGACFVFNENHIWLLKYHNNQWFSIDSISGVKSCDPNSLMKDPSLGFMSVLSKPTCVCVMNRIQTKIKNTLTLLVDPPMDENKYGQEQIAKVVLKSLESKRVLADFEIDMCTYFRLLQLVNPLRVNAYRNYSQFFNHFQNNPGDNNHILQFVPALLHYICITDITISNE